MLFSKATLLDSGDSNNFIIFLKYLFTHYSLPVLYMFSIRMKVKIKPSIIQTVVSINELKQL